MFCLIFNYLEGSCDDGNPGKAMEFGFTISRPGEVTEILKLSKVTEVVTLTIDRRKNYYFL